MANGDWHLDKKVSLGMIAGLMLNFGGMCWWGARLDMSNTNQDGRIEKVEARMDANDRQQLEMTKALSGIQESQRYQYDMLKDVRDQLKSIGNNPGLTLRDGP